jgi:gamma-glutamylcyclotransferase (GGCT)/AIG2-like uncharacterized protein YtfP
MRQIFVYGSLKRGYRLHHLLQGQPFLGTASTCPLYRLHDLGEYPGLVASASGVSVRGEVYEVDDGCLQQLDAAEGVDEGLYVRGPVQLTGLFADRTIHAWFYGGSVHGCQDCGTEWAP